MCFDAEEMEKYFINNGIPWSPAKAISNFLTDIRNHGKIIIENNRGRNMADYLVAPEVIENRIDIGIDTAVEYIQREDFEEKVVEAWNIEMKKPIRNHKETFYIYKALEMCKDE